MTLPVPSSSSKVNILPRDFGSLTRGLPPSVPVGTLFALGVNGGMSVAPDAQFPLIFGRSEPDVHVCVGADDPHVSRQHGHITRDHTRWVLHNVGRLPIRLSPSRLVLSGDWAELPTGYTPLFILGPRQEHLLEVRIAAPSPSAVPGAEYEAKTQGPKVWPLSPVEKLVLVCLGQRYVRNEPYPQPLTWAQVAAELSELQPEERWSERRAAHIVTNVRKRLSRSVRGLLEDEVPPPVGNTLNHNLIMELLISTTILKSDLDLLGD
ncbi:FHA domain-containing protein [Streptomyces litchfieldiae]|uniref:FHA domain-containing protein n=1 Tax=Streptomyces litchfieldiae TaxID=3075543 RepID=A0ABU2MIK2_9ACTN|nr:FHA domain-containing protein [Streptomyces sp. DSM 44938]MDT0341295.1 FHA domain-containing protein [Streptomyces sp. DSM 44938]